MLAEIFFADLGKGESDDRMGEVVMGGFFKLLELVALRNPLAFFAADSLCGREANKPRVVKQLAGGHTAKKRWLQSRRGVWFLHSQFWLSSMFLLLLECTCLSHGQYSPMEPDPRAFLFVAL